MQSSHNTFTGAGRKVGIFLLDGFDAPVALKLQAEVQALNSIPCVVGPRKGSIPSSTSGVSVQTQFTFETCRSTHFDALFFVGGSGPEYLTSLNKSGRMIHAARESYAHFKAIGASGNAAEWLKRIALVGEPIAEENVPGIVLGGEGLSEGALSTLTERFLNEAGKHRAWGRDVSAVAA